MRIMLTVLYWCAIEELPLRVRADHQADGAMGVDMVGAVLGVVFDHEDGHLGPVLAVGDGLDDLAQRQVVAGHAGPRRERSRPGAGRVVFAQAHHREPGQVVVFLVFAELADVGIGIVGVAVTSAGHLADPVIRAHVADQARHRSLDLERAIRLADPPAVLTVAAIG